MFTQIDVDQPQVLSYRNVKYIESYVNFISSKHTVLYDAKKDICPDIFVIHQDLSRHVRFTKT